MVFCNTVKSCRFVHHFLTENNIQASCYHGDIPTEQRRIEFDNFCTHKTNIIVCSDIASRGLDLNIDHVIMFDFPLNPIDYIHRVGRTARANKKGKVSNLLMKRDRVLADNIRNAIENNLNLDGLTSSLNSEYVPRDRILASSVDE